MPDELTTEEKRGVDPAEAEQRLREGNARYVAGESSLRDYTAGRAERAAAQYPFAAVLSCADSRVAPELAFDQGPGDLFVVRVAGNLVDDYGLASLEYAVKYLGVSLIVVLGHSGCGAVKAAGEVYRDKAEVPGALPGLIAGIKPAVVDILDRESSSSVDDLIDELVAANVDHNVAALEGESPVLAPRREAAELSIVGATYDIKSGAISFR
ncbi:carbonic anhydrase [Ornithinimicrobium sp. Y1847]|uniref:carbonic anhydrase n=1 Tax=Ornithinimicrobium sp. Y1847 TaxID=3405419 RepID=UPI003B66D53E